MIDIRPAALPGDLATVRALFRAYADALDVDLAFQDFEGELARLPDQYAAPRGRILVAWHEDVNGGVNDGTAAAVGCVALRPLAGADCEMKRLYVSPAVRGERLGRRLAMRVCETARDAGYRRICLDTLPSMTAAIALYASIGFVPIDPYVFNPIEGALFLAKAL